MSFILDALKKSERERQRQTNPGLFEVKVAPPRNRFPFWAVVIGALLAVNSGVIIWLLIHNSSKGEEVQAAPAANVAPAVPAPEPGPAKWPPPNTDQSPPQPGSQPYSDNPQYVGNAPPESGGAEYFGDPAGASYNSRQDSAAPARKEPSSDSSDEPLLNPDDYEPAVETPRASRSASARKPKPAESVPKSDSDTESAEDRAARKAEKGLPTYQDAAAMPGVNLPQLRLDLHVYDPEPQKSFVLVNMQKVKPGDTFAQGVHVDQITPNGAILSYHGVRFLLHSE